MISRQPSPFVRLRLIYQGGGQLQEPHQVWCSRANRVIRTLAIVAPIQDDAVRPFLDLGVTVAKRDTAGVIVIGRRAINPSSVAGKIEKVSIVDAVGVLIQKEPKAGRPGD